MLLAGDVTGHSQNGNNNSYCQDNEINWMDWRPEGIDAQLLAFAQRLIALRKQHPVFRRRNFFQGRSIKGEGVKDILWLRPDGREMTDEEWGQESARNLGVFLSGEGLEEQDDRAQPIRDQNFLMLMNAHHQPVPFQLPAVAAGAVWIVLIDTSLPTSDSPGTLYLDGATYSLQARSLVLLTERPKDQVRSKERKHET